MHPERQGQAADLAIYRLAIVVSLDRHAIRRHTSRAENKMREERAALGTDPS